MGPRGRHGARRLLLQALYQRQVGAHDAAELRSQFMDRDEFARIDQAYFLALLDEILEAVAALDETIQKAADRPIAQLDPVEHGVLWIGLAELQFHPDVPHKVVIDEAVQLAREFGAQDSYRYINAVLDTLAGGLRGTSRLPGTA